MQDAFGLLLLDQVGICFAFFGMLDPLAENPKDMDIEIIHPSENSSFPVLAAEDSPSTEPEANQKRLERKLVSKTYINDEGFMGKCYF